MLGQFSQLSPLVYNQTDRIQGMARYMNRDGASPELMNLLLVFAGMLTVVLILRGVASHNRKKHEAALAKKMAKQKTASQETKVQNNKPSARKR